MSVTVLLVQENTVHEQMNSALADRRDAARAGFANYLKDIDHDSRLWSSMPLTKDALCSISGAWGSLGADAQAHLHTH